MTGAIEQQLRRNVSQNRNPLSLDFQYALSQKLITLFDPKPEYQEHILSLLDLDLIQKKSLKIAIDSMHGVGAGYASEILRNLGHHFLPAFMSLGAKSWLEGFCGENGFYVFYD